MTRMLKMALESAGFLIDTYNDPVLALENFKPNMYDLVILDVRMPKMDVLAYFKSLFLLDCQPIAGLLYLKRYDKENQVWRDLSRL